MASWRRGTGTRVAADDKTLNICIPVAAVYSNVEGTIDWVVCLIVIANRLVDFITETYRVFFFQIRVYDNLGRLVFLEWTPGEASSNHR